MGTIMSYFTDRSNDDEPPAKKRKLSNGSSVPSGDYARLNQMCQIKDQHVLHLQTENERLRATQGEYNGLKRKYEEEKNAKDEALRRLSVMASSKLRDNNPNIADLSDQNRPTKIAEKMSELYDNQWTDAYDALVEKRLNEENIIKVLRGLLMDSYEECRSIASCNYFEKVQRCIELPLSAQERRITTPKSSLPDQLKQQIKEFRKSRALHVIKDVEMAIKGNLTSRYNNVEEVRKYISGCVELSWLMAVQDPPLVLTAMCPSKFDTKCFKEYTKRGPYVDYVVWPAMYLHEKGPLLAKGVAQGCDHPPRRH